MTLKAIDWNRQAKDFLTALGWTTETDNPYIGGDMLCHSLFPLYDDCSGKDGYLKLAERHGKIWKDYQACIKGLVILNESQAEEQASDESI